MVRVCSTETEEGSCHWPERSVFADSFVRRTRPHQTYHLQKGGFQSHFEQQYRSIHINALMTLKDQLPLWKSLGVPPKINFWLRQKWWIIQESVPLHNCNSNHGQVVDIEVLFGVTKFWSDTAISACCMDCKDRHSRPVVDHAQFLFTDPSLTFQDRWTSHIWSGMGWWLKEKLLVKIQAMF